MLRLVFSCSSVYPTIYLGGSDGYGPATHVKSQTIALIFCMTVSSVKAFLRCSKRTFEMGHYSNSNANNY